MTLGDHDNALAWVEQVYAKNSGVLIRMCIKVESAFEPFHSHPRFTTSLEKLGLEE
jgi:hypothetical protein